MPHRSKLAIPKYTKAEHELHIITNPLLENQLNTSKMYDYQAPLTARQLLPNSKWIIVRNNLHRIRSWNRIDSLRIEKNAYDWYIFLQMIRELRRAQNYIKKIENQPNFIPLRYFDLPIDEKRTQRYNLSHLRPADALCHSSFGNEPIGIQALLHYFSKEHFVSHNDIFQPFLSDVCSVVHRNEQRLKRVVVFRRVAFVITFIFFMFLALMLCTLMISVWKTTANLKEMYRTDPDGGIEWRESKTFNYL